MVGVSVFTDAEMLTAVGHLENLWLCKTPADLEGRAAHPAPTGTAE